MDASTASTFFFTDGRYVWWRKYHSRPLTSKIVATLYRIWAQVSISSFPWSIVHAFKGHTLPYIHKNHTDKCSKENRHHLYVHVLSHRLLITGYNLLLTLTLSEFSISGGGSSDQIGRQCCIMIGTKEETMNANEKKMRRLYDDLNTESWEIIQITFLRHGTHSHSTLLSLRDTLDNYAILEEQESHIKTFPLK